MDDKPLASVHDALQNASLASRPTKGSSGSPTSFRLEDDLKARVMEICARHGTTLSEYLRQACISLDADYPTAEG